MSCTSLPCVVRRRRRNQEVEEGTHSKSSTNALFWQTICPKEVMVDKFNNLLTVSFCKVVCLICSIVLFRTCLTNMVLLFSLFTRSMKHPTIPREPKFHMPQHKKIKCLVMEWHVLSQHKKSMNASFLHHSLHNIIIKMQINGSVLRYYKKIQTNVFQTSSN